MLAMSTLLTLAVDDKKDFILDLVMTFLASYAGLAGGVSLLVELLKMLWKDWVRPKAPALTIVFTFLLGPAAKLVMPEVYGPSNFKGWALHFIILVFVAVLAAAFHDSFWNTVKGKLGSLIPGGSNSDAELPKP